jgi:protein SCO1/2
MNSRLIQNSVWAFLALVILGIVAAFIVSKPVPKAQPLPVLARVNDFKLTNQLGQPVSLDSLTGQVWVANLIFSRCPTVCPQMTQRFAEIQRALPPGQPVKLVSVTADPVFDTPEVLKKFAGRFGVDEARWSFLTGPRQAVFELAVGGLKFAVAEKKPGEREFPDDLFIHSTMFMVVDKQGRLRRAVEGMEPPAKEQVLAAVDALLKEK